MNGCYGNSPWRYQASGALGSYLNLNTAVIPASAPGTQCGHLASLWLLIQPGHNLHSLSMWKEERAGKERHVDPIRWKPAKQNHMGSSWSFPISPGMTAGMTYKRPSQVHSHCSSLRRDKGRGREKHVTPAGSLSSFLGQPLFTCGLQVAGAEPINTTEEPVGLAGGGHLSGGYETTVNHLPAKPDFLPNSLGQRATQM